MRVVGEVIGVRPHSFHVFGTTSEQVGPGQAQLLHGGQEFPVTLQGHQSPSCQYYIPCSFESGLPLLL